MGEDILDRLIREVEASDASSPDVESAPSEPSPVPASAWEAEASAGASPAPASGVMPLAGLLSNPAVWSALPTLLGSVGGKSGGATANQKPDRHTALLCAIKPYLGRERQQTAEQLISLCRLWDTLQSTGLTRMLLALPGGNTSGAAVSAGGVAEDASPKEG